ncbi:MAG: hypothetical protein A3J47_03270 [Candidatus Yanofskybacteria bacterium RIFCSPHIGHO2_02_FULL_43_22]|uniref:Transcriptional regulatory protein n=1 Tax=Candidatus Yanofskybacteria bacterium RIFCSPHIGHO2_02_FULL_43_22 TaxID=1802681 RepID=A0A1F8FTS2_9BACT|nr:MAG: hypothetical protein A3J47_03270 [Candidatus Yanofskybacteria bacterium RIFCSPHIGHO2_02_FULL_43_22]
MSGHSRWSQIKRRKGITDQKRGQIFSKLSKNITLAARKGADPKNNIALANAIEQARRENMPNDNIERAIKKASEKDSAQLEEIMVEAIGPTGVALRIRGVTDNKNRTISEIKKVLSNHESKMVQPGSIGWMFHTPVQINEQIQQKIDELLEALDDLDDVSDVSSNITNDQQPTTNNK